MPAKAMVFRWLAVNEGFRDQYARARETQADSLADDILSIADDARNDWMEKHGEDDKGWQENGEALRRSQLRIDSRKWLAGKMKPKKYGDKIEQTVQNPDGTGILNPLTALLRAIDGKTRSV
jgi:hypothetical protein